VSTTTFGASTVTEPTREALRMAGLDPEDVVALVRAVLAEDLSDVGDLTSNATVPAETRLAAAFVSRTAGVVCGMPVLAAVVDVVVGADASLTLLVDDGDQVQPGQQLATLDAPARAVLALERTSLNLLGHLGGIATATRAWVDAIAGTGARVRDTRKTMPLLRSLEKYAVRCGGGTNHRAGLFDAILIKDNHVAAAGGVGAALDAAYAAHPRGSVPVQVEVDSLPQLDEALTHGAQQVLLDNFDLATLSAAVRRARAVAPGTVLEASGGLRLDDARAVAETGVDLIAVGAITHSASVLDIGLDIGPDPQADRPQML
jgi:nicotinate-nucleotide pyrophosphorylase (carboxylating)